MSKYLTVLCAVLLGTSETQANPVSVPSPDRQSENRINLEPIKVRIYKISNQNYNSLLLLEKNKKKSNKKDIITTGHKR